MAAHVRRSQFPGRSRQPGPRPGTNPGGGPGRCRLVVSSTSRPDAASNGTAEAGSLTVDRQVHRLQRSSVSLLGTPDPPAASRLPSFPVSVSSAWTCVPYQGRSPGDAGLLPFDGSRRWPSGEWRVHRRAAGQGTCRCDWSGRGGSNDADQRQHGSELPSRHRRYPGQGDNRAAGRAALSCLVRPRKIPPAMSTSG